MAFVPFANTCQVNIRGRLDGQQCENTMYFESVGGALTPTLLQLIAEDVMANWISELQPLKSSTCTFTEVFAFDLSTEGSFGFTAIPGAPVSGEAGAPPLPNNVSLAVSFRSAFRGRSGRGRNYWYGLVEDQFAGNNATTAIQTAILAGYDTLVGSALTNGFVHVVASRFTNNAPRLVGAIFPVQAITITDSTLDSQRRRLPGRGR